MNAIQRYTGNALRIKICGITRYDDAARAVDLGADALGFVFYEGSPRHIDFTAAANIIAQLPAGIAKVGVFVRPDQRFVDTAVRNAGIDTLQLHGVTAAVDLHRSPGRTTILVVPVQMNGPEPHAAALIPRADAVLLDTHHPQQHGGTGNAFDWRHAAALAMTNALILAGGLHHANVRQAVETVLPFAVDVSSGVERKPGIKDPNKLKMFFQMLEDFRNDSQPQNREFLALSR